MTQKSKEQVAIVLNERVNNALANNNKQLFEKAFVMSTAIVELKELLTNEVMAPIMALQGNKLGFKTDKDKSGGYPIEVVRNCVIEATLSGLQVVGNQFNIIAGNAYGTREGFGALLKNMPDLHYEISFDLPKVSADKSSAAVTAHISWQTKGQTFKRKLDFPVRSDQYTTTDAIMGKAERKARKWLYSLLTGTDIGEGDIQDIPHTVVEQKPAEELKAEKEGERLLKLIEQADTITKLSELKPHVKTDAQKEAYNKKHIELMKIQKGKTESATAANVAEAGGGNGSEKPNANS